MRTLLDAQLLRARREDRKRLGVVDARAAARLVAVVALAALLPQPARLI